MLSSVYPLFIKLPNRERRLPFFLTLPLTDPISPFVPPLELVLAPRGPRVSLPAKLNRFPSIARGFGLSRVGDAIGDFDRVGETNDMGAFFVGDVTGDVTDNEGCFLGVAGGPTRRAGTSYGAVTRIDGREDKSDGRGVDANSDWSVSK